LSRLAELIKETRQSKAKARQQRIEEEKAAEQFRQQEQASEPQREDGTTRSHASSEHPENPPVDVEATNTESPSNGKLLIPLMCTD
jgi:hypothetical protein